MTHSPDAVASPDDATTNPSPNLPVVDVDVLIVGSGPSGISTALHLLKRDPSFKDRLLVVDKATHPREKLCGGAITFPGEGILLSLGLDPEVPSFCAAEVRMMAGSKSVRMRGDHLVRIVHRAEFDRWFVEQARARGVRVQEGEAVKRVVPEDAHVVVETTRARYHAKILVAADGSKSFVRHALAWEGEQCVARLLEVLTPGAPDDHWEYKERCAAFYLDPVKDGVQGYYWDFPSVVDGEPKMNRGVFDSRAVSSRDMADLKGALRQELDDRDLSLDDYKLKGHPIRWFDPSGPLARPRVILVGDAAGAEPLFGEGITFAIAYGKVATSAILHAFSSRDFSFSSYKRRVLTSHVTWQLPFRVWLARMLYRLKSVRALERFATALGLVVALSPLRNGKWKPNARLRARVARARLSS